MKRNIVFFKVLSVICIGFTLVSFTQRDIFAFSIPACSYLKAEISLWHCVRWVGVGSVVGQRWVTQMMPSIFQFGVGFMLGLQNLCGI